MHLLFALNFINKTHFCYIYENFFPSLFYVKILNDFLKTGVTPERN